MIIGIHGLPFRGRISIAAVSVRKVSVRPRNRLRLRSTRFRFGMAAWHRDEVLVDSLGAHLHPSQLARNYANDENVLRRIP